MLLTMNLAHRSMWYGWSRTTKAFTVLALLVSLVSSDTFNNPVLWEDLADLDIFRVDDTFYYSASTMHYSPGAPILKSYDLVNWEFIGHSVPTLPWGAKYNLTGGQAYVKGIYASTLRYRPSNGLWYWIGCIEYSTTYVWTSPSVTGPWTEAASISTCYYDCGLLIDDDDTMYIAYGGTDINVAELSSDGLSQVKTETVFTSTVGAIEGNRMYKVNGNYYIFNDLPASAEYVLKATSPFGPYTQKLLESNIQSPVSGSGIPHQGGIVDTLNGDWYYMAFIDNYPGGRTPVLAPITWGSDGFPTITTVNGGWGASYPYPAAKEVLTDFLYTDSFAGDSLSPQWEWNHNPDTEYYSVNDGVVLETATVTSHLYLARNTLTHRIYGPNSRGTIQLTVNNMKTGDRAGLAMLRDSSAYVAIINQGSTFRISQVSGLTMDASWNPLSDGSEEAGVNLPSSTTTIWLRVAANISPGPSDTAQFAYSTDGNTFTSIGSPYQLNNTWEFFMGYRYGIFNYASQSQGGSVVLHSFTMDDQTGVSGAAPNASGSSSTQATTTGASSTGTITSFINTASTSQTSTQSKYGQCGGSGYVGPTLCAAGSTCSVGNPYYSQCL